MKMYVLQVYTGKEIEIAGCIRNIGIPAYAPQEARLIRRGGTWREEARTLLPGYVFINLDSVAEDYYRLRQISGIVRFLELNGGRAVALTEPEARMILSWCSGGTAPVSTVLVEGNTVTPLDGPLKVYANAGRPIKYNLHRRQATIFRLATIGKDLVLSFYATFKSPVNTRG